MIDARELRIDNWYRKRYSNGNFTDYTLDMMSFYSIYSGDVGYEPIPLTEEWMVKFGYNFHSANIQYGVNIQSWIISGNQFGHLEIWDLNGSLKTIKYNAGNGNYVDLKYVHQLQNLFFALTGTELEVK